MKTHTHQLFCLMLGILCSFAIQAQEQTEAEMLKEAQEFYEYQLKIENFEKLGAKGVKTQNVPRPPGLDPCISMGGDQGNMKSWELYRKTVGNMMAKEKKPNGFYSKRAVDMKKILNNARRAKTSTDDKETTPNTRLSAKASSNEPEIIPNFGTGANQTRTFEIEDSLGNGDLVVIAEEEDNHSLPTAQKIELIPNVSVFIEASLENLEKSGELSADHDVFEFETKKGVEYHFRIFDTAEQSISKRLQIYRFNDPGFANLNRFEDSRVFDGFTSYRYVEEKEGITLRLSIMPEASYRIDSREDLPDEVYEVTEETTYLLAITEIVDPVVKTYELALKEGDVFGVTGSSFEAIQNSLSLESADKESFIKTSSYGVFPFPIPNNALPTAGEHGFHYVIPKTGTYFLKVSEGFGGYFLEGGVSRSGFEERIGGFPEQIIFLNYAGAEIGANEFFKLDVTDDEVSNLSPLRSYMTNWGLEENQTRNLSRKITNVIKEKLESLSSITGGNQNLTIISDSGNPRTRDFIVEALGAFDIPYSRIIIGGSRNEVSFLSAVGLASSVDVGNFDLEDNAIVLLDLLSRESEPGFPTINLIPLGEGAEKIDLVAEVVGDIAAHEAGHFLGNWHADNLNEIIGTMDQGGAYIGNRAGILEGDAFGDAQNVKVTFVAEAYTPSEVFEGLNQTDLNTAFALNNKTNIASKGTYPLVAFMNKLNDFENPSSLPSISSYPNPQRVSEIATLAINSETDGALSISLFDMQGRKISEVYSGNTKAGELLELAIDPAEFNLGSGVYFYKIASDLEQKNHKFIIE